MNVWLKDFKIFYGRAMQIVKVMYNLDKISWYELFNFEPLLFSLRDNRAINKRTINVKQAKIF